MPALRTVIRPRIGAMVLFGALAGATVAVPAEVHAQPAAAKKPDKKTIDAARTAYGEGEKAYGEGDYAAAEESFRKANDLIPTPHAEYWIAMSIDKQGKTKEAAEAFEALLARDDIAKLGAEKTETAQQRLAALTKAKLVVKSTPSGASVKVDGLTQSDTTPLELELAAGKHAVEVSLEGHLPQTLEVELAAAETEEQRVTLEPEPAAEPVASAPAPEPAPEPEPEPPPKERSKVPAFVTLGVAGASAIVGTAFGIMALGDKSDFNKDPTTNHADDVERNALIADMAFGVAITLGVTGIVLLTTGDDDEDPAKEARVEKRERSRLVVAPYASPTGGGAAAHWTF